MELTNAMLGLQRQGKNMNQTTKIVAGVAVAIMLAGCSETTGGGSSSARTPNAAEQACLRDVTRETNNPNVVLLDSSFSQAGTEVIVGVGPQRARWRCIAYADGTTAGIMSLTNEGAL